MASTIQTIEQDLAFVANLAITITVDGAELAAGQPVSLPKVQVGSTGGKPIYLEAVLSTT